MGRLRASARASGCPRASGRLVLVRCRRLVGEVRDDSFAPGAIVCAEGAVASASRPFRACREPRPGRLLHARLSDKGIAKMVAHCRCGGRQGGRVRRRVHRRPACDGWIGQFRSLPLERIERARRGFSRQPHAQAEAAQCEPRRRESGPDNERGRPPSRRRPRPCPTSAHECSVADQRPDLPQPLARVSAGLRHGPLDAVG